MASFKWAFLMGWQRSLHWWLLIPLYLTALLLGLVQTWPVWVFGAGGTSPHLATIATGELDALVNLLMGNQPAQLRAITGSILWVGLGLGLTLLSNLAYNFFCGGILSIWAGRPDFWKGCRQFFGPFLVVAIVVGFLLGLLTPLFVIILAISRTAGLVLVILLISLVSLLGEYTRAVVVVHEERNAFKGLGLAFQFGARHLPGVMTLGLTGLVLQGLVLQFYLSLPDTVEGILLWVVLQQLVFLLLLWLKLLRLGWALSYIQTTQAEPVSPT